jgi:putative oligomerization/nucleic acid binding protein
MSSRRLAKISLAAAVVMMIVSVGGFIFALVLNTFFLDKYNAYGEVPIPGSGSLYLPAGEVTVSLHTVVISGPDGGGLPVPPLGVTITPPDGLVQPTMSESIGSTTTVNNDAHVRVWVVHVPTAGTYNVTTDGQVNGFIAPRLAFGHSSSHGFLVWLFVAMFVVGLVDSIVSGWWLARTRRKVAAAVVQAAHALGPTVVPVVPVPSPYTPPVTAPEPTDEGVRLERLKTLAALRDSGALTEQEFQTEKQRILEGH